ncbi:MAG: histidine--tRNA ligase [Betaproteobacteria bacterium]
MTAAATPVKQTVLQAVKGMNDLLPADSALWELFEDTVRGVFRQYGYRLIRTPIVEPTPLFVRSIGEVTDIVEKEMYSFVDSMNGDPLTLRPEATAGIVRAAIEHSLLYNGPLRVWTVGPMFRHERPQKGRYRQFYQFDVEALGFDGPDVDAEQIVMLARLWKQFDLHDVELQLNSIGDADERRAHREQLIRHFSANEDLLDADAKRRLHSNPLRILDSKNPALQELVGAAPKLLDGLGNASQAHFEGLRTLLDGAAIPYTINPRLVRGMDYYNRTVFEFVAPIDNVPLTITGGGRYDGLFEQLGGKPSPATGFGMGIDRVILALQQRGVRADVAPDAYVIHSGADTAAVAMRAAEALRDSGRSIVVHAGGGSFKSQMKKADASGARYALIVGEAEATADEVSIKPLRESGEQIRVPVAGLSERFAKIQ